MSTAKKLPLNGVTVLGIEQAVAAPFCTARLADAGARVIKIERPEGDFARAYDEAANGQSSYFVWLNRGKESLALDITSERGPTEIRRILTQTDVLVTNLRPGALERLGLGATELRRDFPQLINCSISGYGESGPMASRKAYDLLVQAESGLCTITGGPSEPSRVGISVVDIATGASAHAAILEALIARSVDGKGADIKVSMFDVIAEWLTVPLLNHEAGTTPKRLGLAHPSIAPYGAFATRDGHKILIAVQSDREWATLCTEFLNEPAAVRDPHFATNVARVTNRSQTDAIVANGFAVLDADAAQAALLNADVAFALVNDMAGLSAHPLLRRITIDTPEGLVTLPAPGAQILDQDRPYGPVPRLNAHRPI